MKYLSVFLSLTFSLALSSLVLSSLVFSQEVTVAIEALNLESSYIEYTGYVNERDHDFVARAAPNSLNLTYTPDALDQNFSLTITALANDFSSGNWLRDQNGRRTVFQSRKYPEIKFSANSLTLGEVSEDERQLAELMGQITIKDILKDISVPISIQEDDALTVSGQFTVLLSDFDIKRPSAIGEVVDDDILISFFIKLN